MAARLLAGGAGLLLVFSACSSDSASQSGSLPTIATVDPSTSVVPTVAPTSAEPTTTTTVAPPVTPAPVEGAALLLQAVAAAGAGYHFNQTATVDGAVAVTIDGDRLPSGTRLSVSNDAGVVDYVITPDGTWLKTQDGDWELDDSPAPAVDPIAALDAPTSVTVAANDGTIVQLVVMVPNAALGLAGDGDASVQVAVVAGAFNSISYSTTTSDGKTAVATTAFSPVVDATPVVPPI